jgi:hypothetical protein
MTPVRAFFATLIATTTALLAGCGGGGALDNPPDIANPQGALGQKLSYVYFQRCVNPVLNAQLRVVINGVATINTCASGGCHDNGTGTGGALRLFGSAPAADPSLGAATVRASDMYKNYYSSLGETVVGSPDQSRIMNKPLVRGVLHGGGLIFDSVDTPEAKRFRYWISRPMPLGQDEFSPAANSMFANSDPVNGVCNTD